MREWRWKCGSRDRGGGGFSSCFNNETLSWKLKSSGVFMWTALVFVYVSVRCATSVSARPLKCVYVCVYICISVCVCVCVSARACVYEWGDRKKDIPKAWERVRMSERKRRSMRMYIYCICTSIILQVNMCVCVSVF